MGLSSIFIKIFKIQDSSPNRPSYLGSTPADISPVPGYTGISRPVRTLFCPAILVRHVMLPPVTQPDPSFCRPGDKARMHTNKGGQWGRG